MYRALPEVSPICATADRNRQYKLHQKKLAEISKGGHLQGDELPPAKGRSGGRTRALKEAEDLRIQQENEKMKQAIKKVGPTVTREEFAKEHRASQARVKRMAGHKQGTYGFQEEPEKPKRATKPGAAEAPPKSDQEKAKPEKAKQEKPKAKPAAKPEPKPKAQAPEPKVQPPPAAVKEPEPEAPAEEEAPAPKMDQEPRDIGISLVTKPQAPEPEAEESEGDGDAEEDGEEDNEEEA